GARRQPGPLDGPTGHRRRGARRRPAGEEGLRGRCAVTSYIGKPILRKEDRRMIQGLATYVDDIELPDLHHVAILRSPHAHARVQSIDKQAALAHPGVIDVVTGEDTKHIGTVPVAAVVPPDRRSPKTPVLAENKVRFVGEPVAAVVAATKEAARDALELVA